MFRVVLIDDDPLTVMGMKRFIKWEEYDFVIAGEALDGLEGLKVCREVKPDLAIIDMKMPGLTDIELIKHINAEISDTEVIILSAYGEFELARQAIKLNVYDYLLKPIQRKQFIDIIEKVSDKLKKAAKDYNAADQDDESRKLIKDIKRFIHQNLNREITLKHMAKEFSLNEYYISHLFKKETGTNFLHFMYNYITICLIYWEIHNEINRQSCLG